jgi:predicted acyl esterase
MVKPPTIRHTGSRIVRTWLSVAVAVIAASSSVAPSANAQTNVSTSTLNFAVTVGPQGQRHCNIVGDLYRPTSATKDRPAPAILTTNGFGGSKDDQAAMAREFARQGYVVLAYSGLGFGGSSCRISLDNPDFDGIAARQLVSYLGGADGIAFYDAAHTKPAPPLSVVQRDDRDHAGNPSKHDPRVGMVGGSYGGQVQFAAASVDPRIDAITPMITWNDLRYSLAPNHNRQSSPSNYTPGAVKAIWANGFVAIGMAAGLQNAKADRSRLAGCPNYSAYICPTILSADIEGNISSAALKRLHAASVSSYMSKITIPTLIIQGEADTLFNLREGAANYTALRDRGVQTQMIWYSGGHGSKSGPLGEFDADSPNSTTQYVFGRINDWLDRFLKGTSVPASPAFTFYQPWAGTPTAGQSAQNMYGQSPTYPVRASRTYTLTERSLILDGRSNRGIQRFTTPPLGAPTSANRLDVLGLTLAESDAPGSGAHWRTPALTSPVRVVGAPVARLKINAPTTSQRPRPEQLIVFARIIDVAPDGTRTTVGSQIAPIRIPNPREPITVDLPDIVHEFTPGHRIELVIAGGSTNYRGGMNPIPVSIDTGAHRQQITFPTVS